MIITKDRQETRLSTFPLPCEDKLNATAHQGRAKHDLISIN